MASILKAVIVCVGLFYLVDAQKCMSCDQKAPKLIEPVKTLPSDPTTTTAPETIDGCMQKTAKCINTQKEPDESGWLTFNAKETVSNSTWDESRTAACRADPECDATLICDAEGHWTAKAFNGQMVTVDSLFCD